MKPTSRGRGLSIELAITIFGVMLSYWTGKNHAAQLLNH
jgi:hypothetical protein